MILFLKNVLFTLLVPGTVAVYIPLRVVAERLDILRSSWGAQQFLALFPLAFGTLVYFWCLWDFAVAGHGTPAPIDAPKNLVVRGLYRYVRNPMYVGVLLVVASWALFFQSREILSYWIAVGFLFHLFVVFVEEPMLERKFGESYSSYCKEVGRWLPKRARNQPASPCAPR